MGVLQEYKCPSCGGTVEFDSSTQKMKCPYCDSEFDIEALQANNESLADDEMDWKMSSDSWKSDEAGSLRSYICESCGAEIVTDETTGATSCPYCGNNVVMKNQFSGGLRPDYIIPFKLDKKAAKEGLMKHLTGKKLLPKVFKSQNHIDEVKGIYVPFWLFDADVDASVKYDATTVRVWSDGDYEYTETSHYALHRAGSLGFERIPVDSSSKIDNTLTEAIEPFNFNDLKPFQTAYLAGYLADKYDVKSDDCIVRANERIKFSTEDAFKKTTSGYASVTPSDSYIKLKNGSAKYALLPVWVLNTTWQGKKYVFAMNGQTGKFIGDLPVDKGAAAKWTIGLTAAIGAAAYGIAWLLWLAGIIGG